MKRVLLYFGGFLMGVAMLAELFVALQPVVRVEAQLAGLLVFFVGYGMRDFAKRHY